MHRIVLVIMLFSFASIILTVMEIALFLRHRLKPLAYLLVQCAKSTMWFIVFLIAVADGVGGQSTKENAMGSKTTVWEFAIVLYVAFFLFARNRQKA